MVEMYCLDCEKKFPEEKVEEWDVEYQGEKGWRKVGLPHCPYCDSKNVE